MKLKVETRKNRSRFRGVDRVFLDMGPVESRSSSAGEDSSQPAFSSSNKGCWNQGMSMSQANSRHFFGFSHEIFWEILVKI